jgi:ubiquinone biosynthesis monooxygenase Coq7
VVRPSACARLDSRPSLLNPLWYAGSYAIGLVAGLRGDGWNRGFVVETERQVEAHLDEHCRRCRKQTPAVARSCR